MSPVRHDRHLDPQRLHERRHGGTAGGHDDLGGEFPGRGLEAPDAAALREDLRHFHLLLEGGAALLGRVRESDRDFVGAREPVLRREGRPGHIVGAEEWPARRHFLRGQERDVDSELPLKRDALLEMPELLGRDGEKEISDLMEFGVGSERFPKSLVERDRIEGELDVGLGRELGADPSGGAARVAAAEELALEHDGF